MVPVLAGGAGVWLGSGMLGKTGAFSVTVDSHFRYLSGLLLGIGCAFWSTVPHIEKNTVVFRILTAIVFIGGLARLYALITVGMPEKGMIFGLGMELVVTPLLAVWQGIIAQKASKTQINAPIQ